MHPNRLAVDITTRLLDRRVNIHTGNDAGMASEYSLPLIEKVVLSMPLLILSSVVGCKEGDIATIIRAVAKYLRSSLCGGDFDMVNTPDKFPL